MKKLFMLIILAMLVNIASAQDTVFDLPVSFATLNGKPTLEELTKKKSLSFALMTSTKGDKLTAWVDTEIAMDGALEIISHKKHEKTKDKLGGYEANYIWETIDDNGKLAKFSVAFHIIVDPKGDRFILEVRRGDNTHIYRGYIKILAP